MEVEVLLECTHFAHVRIENVLLTPQEDDSILCNMCNQERKVVRVGTPYRINRSEIVDDPNHPQEGLEL